MDNHHPLLLPPGTRLLHIGPPKTATTTLQSAFHNNRDFLADHRVHYAGSGLHPMTAAMAVAVRRPDSEPAHKRERRWRALVEEIEGADADCVVVSSEFFASADDAAARRVINDLGADRTHVVVTLRPLWKILPSQWQQYVQDGLVDAYDDWLDAMFNQPPYRKPTPSFWRRHRHDQLVARWAAAVGAENVTVVVLDEADRPLPVRVFERFTGLPEGSLNPEHEAANRSLTRDEAEIVRAFNRQYKEHGWPREVYQKFMRFGSARYLKERAPFRHEERVETPQWALDAATELGGEIAAAIATSGVRIIGDIEALGTKPPANGSAGTEETRVPAELAARMAIGVLRATGELDTLQTTPVSDATSRELVRVVGLRVRARVDRTVRATRTRARRPRR